MEDAHICLTSLSDDAGRWQDVAMFGVLDGHGGEQVAKFCHRHLPKELRAWPLSDNGPGPPSEDDFRAALTGAFQRMDELLRGRHAGAELRALTNPPHPEAMKAHKSGLVDPKNVGCTCCICCLTEQKIVVANAGDSRAVLCRGGVAMPLSEDHKPNQAREQDRIKAAGGYVETQNSPAGTQYRVNGNLNLSRAIGDLEYKQDKSLPPEEQIISAEPDVGFTTRSYDDEFLIICCDGVWDMKSNQEVVDFVRTRLSAVSESEDRTKAALRIIEELLDDCVSPDLQATRGLGGDNMTAVLVQFPCRPSGLQQTSADEQGKARLLNVRSKASLANDGALVVRLAIPETVRNVEDVLLGVSASTSELEVGVTGAPRPYIISLLDHLPTGAELRPLTSDDPSATFFPESHVLRVSLPWVAGS